MQPDRARHGLRPLGNLALEDRSHILLVFVALAPLHRKRLPVRVLVSAWLRCSLHAEKQRLRFPSHPWRRSGVPGAPAPVAVGELGVVPLTRKRVSALVGGTEHLGFGYVRRSPSPMSRAGCVRGTLCCLLIPSRPSSCFSPSVLSVSPSSLLFALTNLIAI